MLMMLKSRSRKIHRSHRRHLPDCIHESLATMICLFAFEQICRLKGKVRWNDNENTCENHI